LLFLIVLTASICGGVHEDACLNVPLNKRVDCGWNGITESECVEQTTSFGDEIGNCCFDRTTNPQCYARLSSACSVIQTLDCGWLNISKRQCEERGCCFISKGSCYYPAKSRCLIASRDRDDCGEFGVTREICEMRDCCFDSRFSPQCYTPKRGKTSRTLLVFTFALPAACMVLVWVVFRWWRLQSHRTNKLR